MRNRSFVDAGHANQYLSGCLILYKNEPIYISEVFTDRRRILLRYAANFHRHIGEKYDELNIRDEDIDMTPFPMGYVNMPKITGKTEIVSTFRTPARLMKIGLCSDNLYTVGGTRSVIYTKAFYNTVLGKFPTVEEALEEAEEGSNVAFSRHFAINNKGQVNYLHLDDPVGVVKNDNIILNDEYIFLKEKLEKDMQCA